MKRVLFLFFNFLFWFSISIAFGEGDPHLRGEKKAETPSATQPKEGKESKITNNNSLYLERQTRQFKDLNIQSPPVEAEIPDVFFNTIQNISDSSRYHINRANALYKKIKQENRLINVLTKDATYQLPLGIPKTIGNIDYTVIIDSINLMTTYAYLSAYMVVESPRSGDSIVFFGKNIPFSNSGGLVGEARMELVTDAPIKLGANTLLTFKGGKNRSYATWDCNGFKELVLEGEVLFSRKLLLPENVDGTIKPAGNVKGSFKTRAISFNDITAKLDFDPFQVSGLNGVGFYVKGVAFDFSETQTPAVVKFPSGYLNSTQEEFNLWEGFYMQEVSVKLPREFNKKEDGGGATGGSSDRISFSGYDLIIDGQGFTGTVTGTGLILPKEGSMGKWAYSLDSLGISILANEIKQAGFNGTLNIPISKESESFAYKAVINPGGDYLFNVTNRSTLTFDVFKAGNVQIFPSSAIDVKVSDGQFYPRAVLHGTMSINAGLGKDDDRAGDDKKLTLANIAFESLELATVKPYLKVAYFSFGSEAAQQKMAGFPVSINNISFRNYGDDEVGIGFDVTVNLQKSSSSGFGGESSLTVVGKLDESGKFSTWKFKGVDVGRIAIDVDNSSFKFKGSLVFFKENPTYGQGFRGDVLAEFTPGIKVTGTALFGAVSDTRYWFVDAMVNFNSGIPIFTGVGIYGFGGGAYHHMKQEGFSENSADDLGRSNSGIVYKPDPNTFLGIKASIAIGTHPRDDAFNADATFEIAFNSNGGVNTISFIGNGYFVTPPIPGAEKLAAMKAKCKVIAKAAPETANAIGNANQRGSISASVFIAYDFTNKTLHGDFKVYANVAGGLIKGIGPGGLAGYVVMHFSPEEWYVHMGTPTNPVGLQFLNLMRTESYLMVGDNIPGSPPPPEEVSEILNGADLDYMRDENALGDGKGFAFGARTMFNTGDLTFLAFYARFAAGLGFDIMLKNYGEEVRCKGRSENLGINGWYANGQAFAYFQGKIGMKVDLKFYKGNYDILELGAAAVLQAKLPNPSWMRGIVGGNYNILNGMVKGNCKFQVTIGEECEIISGSALTGLQLISEVTPSSGSADISVFNAAQAVFNMPVNKEFELVDVDDIKKTFRIKLDYFKLMNGSAEIPGILEWNGEHDVLAFNSVDVLPSKKNLTAKVAISFEEMINGAWRPVIVEGKKITEAMESVFTTGIAPDYIPEENIAYSYPVFNQMNFYKDEYPAGYIKLIKGQPELFETKSEWTQKGKFTSADKKVHTFDFTYSDLQINFTFPSGLNNHTLYSFDLVNIPTNSDKNIDKNVDTLQTIVASDSNGVMTVKTKEAEGTIDLLQEKSIFSTNIKTSRFNTFSAKIDALTVPKGWFRPIYTGVDEIGTDLNGPELFDKIEIFGDKRSPRLIEIEADLEKESWFNNKIKPLVYMDYPLNGLAITWRNVDSLGLYATKAVSLKQFTAPELNQQNISAGSFEIDAGFSSLIYGLAYYNYKDYVEIRQKAANHLLRGSNSFIDKIVLTPFPNIPSGMYKVKLKYTLPGNRKITSTKELSFKNP